MKVWLGILAVLAAALSSTGCIKTNFTAQVRYEHGLVVVLSGAGDMMGEVNSIRGGLNDGGVDWALEHFTWSQGGVFHDQLGVDRNRRMAGRLARRIEGYQAQYPGRPVWIVGVSAGTGVLVWALEDLHEGTTINGAVLLSSSLQSHYDLGPALMHVKEHMYAFRNTHVDVVLGAGVMATGTVDREGMVAGGLYGFSPPKDTSDATHQLYKDKLIDVPWGASDALLGNLGGHLGPTSSAFVRERVAPLVQGMRPGEKPAKVTKAKPVTPARPAPTPDPQGEDPPPARYLWEAYQ